MLEVGSIYLGEWFFIGWLVGYFAKLTVFVGKSLAIENLIPHKSEDLKTCDEGEALCSHVMWEIGTHRRGISSNDCRYGRFFCWTTLKIS